MSKKLNKNYRFCFSFLFRLIDFLKNDADSMMIPPYDRSRYFQVTLNKQLETIFKPLSLNVFVIYCNKVRTSGHLILKDKNYESSFFI